MKINFVIPFPPRKPGGGLKIMIEIASRLSERGHDVIIYSSSNTSYINKKNSLWIRYLYYLLTKSSTPNWIKYDQRLSFKVIPYVHDKFIRDADIIMSTWWSTAIEVNKLSFQKGKKFNYVQDYEIWLGFVEKVHQSYVLNNTKIITIAKYLIKIIKEVSGTAPFYIPYGIDFKKFDIFIPIEKRKPSKVIMLYSEDNRKDSETGIKALLNAKQRVSDLSAILFGVYDRPKNLPDWIEYQKKPDDIPALFNDASIFIQPSIQEGLSLNPIEAKACGCATIYTNIPGHLDHSIDEINCLLTPIGNFKKIAYNIVNLIKDSQLRIRLAKNGYRDIRKLYDWEDSIQQIEMIFNKS